MFWLRKTKFYHHLWFFALIALGIVLATVILIFLLLAKVNKKSLVTAPLVPKLTVSTTVPTNAQSLTVAEKYETEIKNLEEFVSSTDKMDLLLSKLEKKFLQIRVPAEERDKYLKVFLEFFSEKDSLQQSDLITVKQKLLDLLAKLDNKN